MMPDLATDPRWTLLRTSLEAGVMLRIAELINAGPELRDQEFRAHRDEWLHLIASESDKLLYGGGKRGDTARVHTALVNALAHLSFAPGGCNFAGMHFEAVVPSD